TGSTANGGVNVDAVENTMTILLNQPPVITNLAGDTAMFTEDSLVPVFLDDAAAPANVTDADDLNFNGGHLTAPITANKAAGEDVLGIAETGSVHVSGTTVSIGGSPIGTITSNGTNGNDLVVAFNTTDATPANVELLINALTYFNGNTLN